MITRARVAIFAVFFFSANEVRAGMPSPTLADLRRELSLSNLTRMRLETISFFLVGLLVSALVIRVVWNGLGKDFPRLPRLSFGKALGLVALWGLLFVLVPTMISGARELMTPGAWEKKGLTYQLVEQGPSPIERQITGRHQALERLGKALQSHESIQADGASAGEVIDAIAFGHERGADHETGGPLDLARWGENVP